MNPSANAEITKDKAVEYYVDYLMSAWIKIRWKPISRSGIPEKGLWYGPERTGDEETAPETGRNVL
jgi:hypothetical protein